MRDITFTVKSEGMKMNMETREIVNYLTNSLFLTLLMFLTCLFESVSSLYPLMKLRDCMLLLLLPWLPLGQMKTPAGVT